MSLPLKEREDCRGSRIGSSDLLPPGNLLLEWCLVAMVAVRRRPLLSLRPLRRKAGTDLPASAHEARGSASPTSNFFSSLLLLIVARSFSARPSSEEAATTGYDYDHPPSLLTRGGGEEEAPQEEEKHHNMLFVCPMCGLEFESESGLKSHAGGVLPSAEEEPYFCSCEARFCSPQALSAHCLSRGHRPEGDDDDGEEERHECPRCGRGFGSEEALAAHCGGSVPESDDDECLWCECGRAFCSPQALVAHSETTGHSQEQDTLDYDELTNLDHDNYRRGLSEDAIKNLNRRPLDKTRDINTDPITKEPLQGPTVIELLCGHVFEDDTMLLKWFRTGHRTCPLCRHELEP